MDSFRCQAIAFSINGKGYIGGGLNRNIYTCEEDDFWEYDPIANNWTQKGNLPTGFYGNNTQYSQTTFTANGKGYYFDSESHGDNKLWEYNPITDTWIQKTAIPDSTFNYDISFNIGNKGYLGDNTGQRFWEYTPDSTTSCSAQFTMYADTFQAHHYYIVNNASGTGPLTYLWSWGDSYFSTSAYPSHSYGDTGIYNICLTITDTVGCQSTYCDTSYHVVRTKNGLASVTVITPSQVGITEINNSNAFVVYPNPAHDNLSIAFSSNKKQTYSLRLIDITGRIVINNDQTTIIGNNEIELNLSTVPRGLYLILVQNGDGTMQKKIVVE